MAPHQPSLPGLLLLLPGVGCLFVALCLAALYYHRRSSVLLCWSLSWLGLDVWLTEKALHLDLALPELPWTLLDGAAELFAWLALGFWVLGWYLAWPCSLDALPRRLIVRDWLAILAVGAVGVVVVAVAAPTLRQGLLDLARGVAALWSVVLLVSGWVIRRRTGFLVLAATLLLLATVCLVGAVRAVGLDVPRGLELTSLPHAGIVLVTAACMLLVVLDNERRDLRQTVDRLAESEDRFRLIFEHCGVGMALLSPEGRLLQVNPALGHMLGYRAAELVGRRLADFIYLADITSEQPQLPGATDPTPPLYQREKRYLHRDGRSIWARVLRVPVKGADGRVRYFVGVLVDITERKRAEDELAATTLQLRLLNQAAGDGILVTDELGRFLDVNPALCRMLGYNREELLGRRLLELAVDRPALARYHHAIIQGEAGVRLGTQLRGREGRIIEVEMSGGLLLLDGRAFLHGICRDVTQRNKAEAALREARKLETLATLVGGIAHDFNNQLTAVLGNLGLALTDLMPTQDGLLGPLREAERAGRRCAEITQRLLTFSSGRVGSVRSVALGAILHEAISRVHRDGPPTVQAELHQAEELWPVSANASQVEQVLTLLVTNAYEAMPQGGRLTLTARNRELAPPNGAGHVEARPGRFVEMIVRDTGVGIPAEVRQHLFEPFFTTKPDGQGAGMGLAMAYGIVKAHRGWIEVESEPGRGSAFAVFLPAAEELPPPPPSVGEAVRSPQSETSGAGLCVLVVDDEEPVRNLARITLQRRGFRVLTARDGEEALSLYRQELGRIDVVLLDYVMPRLTGLQVLQRLKEIDPNVRVVFSSGYTMDSDSDQLLAIGARGFLPKPYHADDLLRALRRALV